MEDHYRRQKNHGLSLSYQYTESPHPSTQSPLRITSYENYPRTLSDQRFVTPANLLTNNYQLPFSYPMPQPVQQFEPWDQPQMSSTRFNDQNQDTSYDSPSYITGNDDTVYPRAAFSDVPRSWESYSPRTLPETSMVDNYLPSAAYMIDPSKQHSLLADLPNNTSNRNEMSFSPMENARDYASRSTSPVLKNEEITYDGLPFDKPDGHPFSSMALSESSPDGAHTRETTAVVEVDEQGTEEPYAKLIYRALMSAPGHSMVLQEIYQWFRDNTAKGTSETKGWMNSIRHNLSMNAAFKKTERKLSEDEPKKSTEWVLEEFAIRDGVQSTTRYRKGTGNKKAHHHARADSFNPTAVNRQISGRKGGVVSSRAVRTQRQRRDEQQQLSQRRPSQALRRREIFHHQQSLNRQHIAPQSLRIQRQRSPLTPPHPESLPLANTSAGNLASGGYFYPKVEQQYEMPYEALCSLEDVQGVHISSSPLFSGDSGVALQQHQQHLQHHHEELQGFFGDGGGLHDQQVLLHHRLRQQQQQQRQIQDGMGNPDHGF